MTPGEKLGGEITATVAKSSLPITVVERGDLESSKTVDVRCEVEGQQIKIVEIVAEGTRVSKGQLVVRFDTDELSRKHAEQEIKVKQAEGKAKAAKEELAVQTNKAEGDVAKAELALELADIDLKKYPEGEYRIEFEDKKGTIALAERDLRQAQQQLENFRKFVKKGFATREQLQEYESNVENKQFYLGRDKVKLDVLEKWTRMRQETELRAKAEDAKRELVRTRSSGNAAMAKAQSDLDASQVTAGLELRQLKKLKTQLERCVVQAPQDGILVYSKDRYWDPASRIQPGGMVHFQQTLFSLPDLTQMQVKVKIHESNVKKVKQGQQAEFRIDAYPDHVLHGSVQSIATLADSRGYWDERAVKEYVTIVKIDDLPTDAGLKPGMTAEAKILVKELPDVLVVPVQAVAEKEAKHYSYVVGGEGVEQRLVTVGENNEKFVEVKTGLSVGEHVALDARSRVAAEVKAAETKPTETLKPPEPQPTKSTPVASSR